MADFHLSEGYQLLLGKVSAFQTPLTLERNCMAISFPTLALKEEDGREDGAPLLAFRKTQSRA